MFQKRIYLDYAAATPLAPEVFRRMRPYFGEVFGNASAIHEEGARARRAVESAREDVARTLRVRVGDITFTSGGTESNNLAILGLVDALHKEGRAYDDMEIITTAIEHPSIHQVLEILKMKGVSVHFTPVDESGRIDARALEALLNTQTVLVTCAYSNSEVGVVQDLKKIGRIIRAWNDSHDTRVYFHTDASQAPLWLPCQMDMLGVDLMTLDAAKYYGPKGAGVLAHRHGVSLRSQLHGGGQEGGLRSGTENTPLVVGCAAAFVRAQEGFEERSARVSALRDEMIALLTHEIDACVLNGSPEHRIANNVNVSIEGIDGEFAVVTLDAHGIAASTKSACSGASGGGSAVVRTLTDDESRSLSTIRFSLGERTTRKEVLKAVSVLKKHVIRMREFKKTV